MATECRNFGCKNTAGIQNRDDYNSRKYCSIQCQTKHEHLKADAKEAMLDDQPDEPYHEHPGYRGEFL